MTLIDKNGDFEIYFSNWTQTYSVYKNGIFLIDNKIKYSEVESYIK